MPHTSYKVHGKSTGKARQSAVSALHSSVQKVQKAFQHPPKTAKESKKVPLRRDASNSPTFAEPNISHFEILSGLLVNDAVPFTGKNGPYCRRAASLKLGPHRLLTCSDWCSDWARPTPFQSETLRVSVAACTFG